MNLTKKQKTAIGTILAVGLLLAILILVIGKPSSTQDEQGQQKNDHDKEVSKGASPDEGVSDRIVLSEAQIKSAGIVIANAGPAKIANALVLPGEIGFNEDRTAHVVPRVEGVVESVTADLGQPVKKGQVLAVLASTALAEQRSEWLSAQKRLTLAQQTYAREKMLWQEKISAEQDYLQARQALEEAKIALQNASQKLTALGAPAASPGSMNRYEIRAPFNGMVLEKHIALGEVVKEDSKIFTISDLSAVWANLAIPAQHLNEVRVGASVVVKSTAFNASSPGKVAYVGSLLGEQTRTAQARVVLANPNGAWRPGLFVNVEVASVEVAVPVAVAAEALHTVENRPVVFVRTKDGFAAQPVETGKNDGKQVEIVKGLPANAAYAAAGSFILKSELGKDSAEHKH
ncbi:MAG: efflux RND transporter periplasmic adaptor subunit [Proteobacteria bacterium]|nr:efflux RND transporter periplasmic adaptor subunit [Pseudomonadota bacterium]